MSKRNEFLTCSPITCSYQTLGRKGKSMHSEVDLMRSCDQTRTGNVKIGDQFMDRIRHLHPRQPGGKPKNGKNDINGKNDKIGTDGLASRSIGKKRSRTDISECRARDGSEDRTLHRTHPQTHSFLVRATHHQRTCVGSSSRMSWTFESASSQKSSCRHVFHHNLLGVPGPLPLFPTTLFMESATTCADPRSGSWFGRVAEQRTLTGYEPQDLIETSSEHTPIFTIDPNDVQAVAVSDITETLKRDSWRHHCSCRSEGWEQTLRCLCFSASSTQHHLVW